MKDNRLNILIIIIFIGMITLPQVFSYILDEDKNIVVLENRPLSEKPELKLETIKQYPTEFENYYNDHVPFRAKLTNLWANINHKIFNTTIDNKDVIIGKDGWLFYRGEEGQSVEQIQAIEKYSIDDKIQILNNLQISVNKFNDMGIQTFIFIVPNKENIYREYLPDTIPIKNDVSFAEDLITYIRNNSKLNVVYPKQELLNAKQNYQIYKKSDTHWNDVGAFIGTIALQKAIDPNFIYDTNNIEVAELDEKDNRDLAQMASLEDIYDNKVVVKDFYPEIEYTVSDRFLYEEYISNSENDKTILIIGDSFRESMRPYFSKLYKRVCYMHRDKYYWNANLVEEINPDIIIIQAIERYSDYLKWIY